MKTWGHLRKHTDSDCVLLAMSCLFTYNNSGDLWDHDFDSQHQIQLPFNGYMLVGFHVQVYMQSTNL